MNTMLFISRSHNISWHDIRTARWSKVLTSGILAQLKDFRGCEDTGMFFFFIIAEGNAVKLTDGMCKEINLLLDK